MMVLLSLMALTDATAMMNVARTHVVASTAEPVATSRRSRYRLDPSSTIGTDPKAAALADTGAQCAVVGPRLCTRKPRTLYAARY